MSPELLGTVLVGVLSLAAALYTAQQGRKSAAKTAEVASKDSEREAQLAFVGLLSAEVDKLNARVVAFRERLAAAEDELDSERTKRRETDRALVDLMASVEKLQAMLAVIPDLSAHPEIRALVEGILRRRTDGR